MRLVLFSQLLLLGYHQVTTLCDLFPFNGVRFTNRREKWIEAAVNLVLMGLPPLGFFLRYERLIDFAVAYYFILFAIECATWWLPYAFGPSQKWLDIYTRVHRPTIGLLPRRGNNPAPNLEHLILMALTVAAAWVTWRAYPAYHAGPFPHPGIAVGAGVALVAGSCWQMLGHAKEAMPAHRVP